MNDCYIFFWHEQNIVCTTGKHRCLSHVNVAKNLCVHSGLNAVFSGPLFSISYRSCRQGIVLCPDDGVSYDTYCIHYITSFPVTVNH